MPYTLKGESFEIVDGPHKGKKFARGVVYEDVPDTEKKRFTEVAKPAQPVSAAPRQASQPAEKKKDGSDVKPKPAGQAGKADDRRTEE